ncbi:MAG: glutamyl-tRNA synthetase [Parcubacteria group bacterium Gr01-1014_20]|nr:MAG: glutamyl-tRNA synthetase [Parcubacteria group bacterium Gr01-1014_20]
MNPGPKKPVRVRLAPSPTGSLHIGTARTALFNWLFARQNNGKFILRLEDTDKERSEKKFEKEIQEGLKWLGLTWDEGPILNQDSYLGEFGSYRQSERIEVYKKYLQKLLDEKKAYYCYCTKEELEAERQAMIAEGLSPKYNGHCRNQINPKSDREPQVIRFVTSETKIEFTDLVRGKVIFDGSLFGDMVIAKNLETPLYNFAVVVDDEEMKISHVIRGEDHLSNTPKQILMQKALDFETPIYAHLPLILAADRSKLSKRYAETSLLDYREKGYLSSALLNFMALLGWHPEGDEEVMNLQEMTEKFDIKKIQKSGAVFSPEKLTWLNSQHIKNLSNQELFSILSAELKKKNILAEKEFLLKLIEIEKNRLKTINDFIPQTSLFFELPDYEAKLLKWKDETLPEVETSLLKSLGAVEKMSEKEFTAENIREALDSVVDSTSRGQIYWPLRVALSGQKASPDPAEIGSIIGKKETEKRIKLAIEKVTNTRENRYDQSS